MVDAELLAADDLPLTFFEALTVLAFACFADAPVDVAVIEVGMGGEWDSTNVADGQVAVFTPIALDHTQAAGQHRRRDREDQVRHHQTGRASRLGPAGAGGARRVAAGRRPHRVDALHRGCAFSLLSNAVAVGGQVLSVQGLAGLRRPVPPDFGDHQAQNAALAIAAVESFLGDGKQPLSHELVAEGLATATSPGRLQILSLEPTVLIDAAHNPHGAKALAAALPVYFAFDELILVVGILADKDAHGILDALSPLVARIHVTRSRSDRAIPVDELADRIEGWVHDKPELRFESLSEAIAEAREWANAAPRRGVLVTGSITLVGEAIALATEEGWKR